VPVDPESAILANPEVAEEKRFCPHCGAEVGRSSKDGPGRVEGYCPKCRKPYSFTPRLKPGDLVAGQYEVRGCLAHGGQGWIYLAQDKNVSDRWVVLKGMLNAGDESAMQAAIAEQRFLAELQNPLIVEIYNFVTHDSGAYIVMEFVNGRSLKQILKDRMIANNGMYDPFPPDQALAYILEILPAFSYLHERGLLYCDFKPDNLMHVGDSVKLIDMGGVRRIDDDESIIFGTVGFQAPEVPTLGCSIASDIYTIGRTLLVLAAEVKGYQTTYATTMPPVETGSAFTRFDSLYRLILKACAPNPSDRFASVEELRVQTLGVLREVVSAGKASAAVSSAASALFDPPTVVGDVFTWKQLPHLKPDSTDPATAWLATVDTSSPDNLVATLLKAPGQTLAVQLATATACVDAGLTARVDTLVKEMLARDPWEWRAVWIQGLSALNTGQWQSAQAAFNAVYGQLPGELAPKFALAVSCEMGGVLDVAETLYLTCASTDAAYVTGSAFGLARVRAKRKDARGNVEDPNAVLAALDFVPPTSGGWAQSRRLAATYLAHTGAGLADLKRAYAVIASNAEASPDRYRLELEIFSKALPLAKYASMKTAKRRQVDTIGGTPLTKADIRTKIESILRGWAKVERDAPTRVALIDRANAMRGWTPL
jgi:serine/threonine-protein kinase PknG